jgi:hypothetical protein
MALLAPISHGFLEDDGGAPGLYVSEAGVVVLRSTQGGPLVPVGGGRSDIQLARSGVRPFANEDYLIFDSYLLPGATLIKAWAVFSADLNWTGGSPPTCQLVIVEADGTPGTGVDIVTYDLNGGWPAGSGPWLMEFNTVIDPTDQGIYTAKAMEVLTVPGAIEVNIAGGFTDPVGTYEVFALVAPPP